MTVNNPTKWKGMKCSGSEIGGLFFNNVRRFPNRTALWFGGEPLLYKELGRDVRRICLLLKDMGVSSGSHVVILLDNSVEFVVAMLALAELEATLVPLSTSLGAAAIRTAVASTSSEFVLGKHSSLLKQFKQPEAFGGIVRRRCMSVGREVEGCRYYGEAIQFDEDSFELGQTPCRADQSYILTMTSGSTGSPKPIVFTQQTKVDRAMMGAKDLYGLSDDDVIITASPMYHSLGQRLVLLPLMMGGTSVIVPKFTVASWLESVSRYGVTFTIAVSSHLEMLVASPRLSNFDLSSLRTIVSSSALLRDDVKAQCIEKLGCDFHECYGTSEIGIGTNLSPEDCKHRLNSVGRALPYVSLKIMTSEKQECAVGQVGEIACKTKTHFAGYFNNPKATSESVVDGYFYTGDLGYVDEDGYLYLCGRKKELIIVGGTNVYPNDVEDVLNQHPDVKDCAVIGVDDSYFGECILAVIVWREATGSVRDLQRLCSLELADYQQPMAYEVLTELPRNGLGKLMKHKLKERFAGYDASAVLRRMMNIT